MNTDTIGGFAIVAPCCAGCGKFLTVENAWMADGCPCNSRLGVNNLNETRWRLLMDLQQQQSRQIEWLWGNCKIIYHPPSGEYPIEHNPHASKDGRPLIEQAMRGE